MAMRLGGLVSRLPPLSTVAEVTGFALIAGWCYRYDALNCRTNYEVWRAEKKAMEMKERLDRRKRDKTTDAVLEMLERMNASLDAEIYLREVAVLKAHVEICEKEKRMANMTLQATGHQGG